MYRLTSHLGLEGRHEPRLDEELPAKALALTLFGFWGGPRRENAVFGALQAAAAGVAAIGLAKRRESGRWLFWPVWLWNFVMVYALVYLKFFFRVYF